MLVNIPYTTKAVLRGLAAKYPDETFARELSIDLGLRDTTVSQIIRRFAERGLVETRRGPSNHGPERLYATLTQYGLEEYAKLQWMTGEPIRTAVRIPGTYSPTGYLETDLLLAVQEGNHDKIKHLLQQMNRRDAAGLAKTAKALATILQLHAEEDAS